MKPASFESWRTFSLLWLFPLLLEANRLLAEPLPAAASAFQSYAQTVESRLAQQHRAAAGFLAETAFPASVSEARVRAGGLIIERIAPPGDVAGALLHHWRGTAFAPGATATGFERLMRNFSAYPQVFAPQVVRASASAAGNGRIQAMMRVRQRHVLTVVMDTAYDVEFDRLDRQHGYSISRSTRIAEIEAPGGSAERPLGPTEEHGFLWRLNTYWSYEERDGGLYLQLEAVSLTRSIPRGLGWVIKPYIESVPRESLEFTLRSAVHALQK